LTAQEEFGDGAYVPTARFPVSAPPVVNGGTADCGDR